MQSFQSFAALLISEMLKLSFLSRSVLKSRVSVSLLDSIRRVPSKNFCSAGEQQGQPAEEGKEEAFTDSSYESSSQGVVYGRLTGIGRNTLKTDILHLLEESNLSTSDVKFEYNNNFVPNSVMLRFPSLSAYDVALRQIVRKGRLYKFDKINSGKWDITESHDGRTVLVHGIPGNAVREDIERFISGCDYDPSSFKFISRPGVQNAVKAVAFRVASALEARNFQISKNRNFCLNGSVSVRVLQ